MELLPDWLNLSDALFANQSLFLKANNTKSFAFFSSVMISGGLNNASQTTLLSALQMIAADLIALGTPFSVEEIAFINEKLTICQFTIQL